MNKENVSRLRGEGAASTSYLQQGDGDRNNATPNAAAYKSTRFAPRAGGDVKVHSSFFWRRELQVLFYRFFSFLSLSLAFLLQKKLNSVSCRTRPVPRTR